MVRQQGAARGDGRIPPRRVDVLKDLVEQLGRQREQGDLVDDLVRLDELIKRDVRQPRGGPRERTKAHLVLLYTAVVHLDLDP